MHDKHIAMIGDNSYKWITGYLTVLQSTGVFVPVDKELTVKEIINVLKHSESEVFFYSEKYETWIEYGLQSIHNKTLNKITRHLRLMLHISDWDATQESRHYHFYQQIPPPMAYLLGTPSIPYLQN